MAFGQGVGALAIVWLVAAKEAVMARSVVGAAAALSHSQSAALTGRSGGLPSIASNVSFFIFASAPNLCGDYGPTRSVAGGFIGFDPVTVSASRRCSR
jgi:hypothetical protein